MVGTSARLLRLLSLLQSRRHWAGQELGERLEVDVRTVRRDVDKLRDLGYPIEASSGLGGGYQLGAGSTMPPVLLDDDEAVAVAVALRAAAGSVAGLEATAIGLLAKLDQILPPRLRRRASALLSVTVTLPGGAAAPPVDRLTAIASACRDRQRLTLRYRDRGGRDSARTIEPLRVVHTGRVWYLVAWDLRRADWRTFRVDRIVALDDVGPGFTPRDLPEDVATFVARSISQRPYRHQLRVRLDGAIDDLATRVPSWCGVLEADDDAHCVLTTGADTVEALAVQLLLAGAPFEVLDPPALVPALREVADRLSRGVSRPRRARRRPARGHAR
ncbi:MAG: YafY family transcriptional regulator [Kofleriaceae bacterium]|nr:YafY family transcriptional regulator [Kofleriaceae bacterium]MCB9572812.1 YafY family transcriptional regulator [Kofleriaceae bacterium]